MNIRFATLADAKEMDEIYAHYIKNTVATFLYEPLEEQSFAMKLKAYGEELPYIVAEEQGKVVGYAYASYWRYKDAYRWDVESSIYVKFGQVGKGIGKKLYEKLLAVLQLQGYINVYGGITLPNPASVKLHEILGFEKVGLFPKTGYKMGQWLDVIWYGKTLNILKNPPEEPKRIIEIKE